MRQVNCLLLILSLISLSFSQTGNISNISVKKRSQESTIVDIRYDLKGSKLSYYIVIEASFDGGKVYKPLKNVTGDHGPNITQGNDKHVIWKLENSLLKEYSDTTKIRINAKYPPFEFVTINAGEYSWGLDNEKYTIDYDFQIMKYEVTNLEYADYLRAAYSAGLIQANRSSVGGYYRGDERIEAGIYEYINLSSDECKIRFSRGNFYIEKNYENHPVVEESWFGANAFAEYYGCGLPLEEEWEMAARSNTGNEFPWGKTTDGRRANYFDSGDPFDNGTTPVGFYNGQKYKGFQTIDSPSPYGVYDLSGNVWEWTDSYYSRSSTHRVIRGGSWAYSTYCLPSWVRFKAYPYHGLQVGFRVVKDFPKSSRD